MTGQRKKGKSRGAAPSSSAPSSEFTPSGIVPRGGGSAPVSPRQSGDEPPSFRSLTPYQARLDVEMDDTAVSKVRDPSVSISLDAEHVLGPLARRRTLSREAVVPMVVGTLLGALLVVVIALVARLITR